MRLFFELVKRSFQRHLAYRAAAFAGLATNFFFGMLRAAVIIALFNQQPEVAGVSLAAAVTYTGVTQAVIGFLNLFGWTDLMQTVYTGEVAVDLLKPMSYYRFWMAQDLGRGLVQLLLRGLPMMACYALIFGLTTPETPGQWLMLALALFLAWWVSFAWRFVVNLAAFWTPDARGIARIAFTLSWFLSGFIMPLRFLPDWFERLCYLTPFPQTINSVVEIYWGKLSTAEMFSNLMCNS
jgi:ABC-2 type transport system permease protein